MRRAGAAVVLLTAALLQIAWAPRLEIAGAFPNLILLAVIAITWRRGVRAGLAAACAGGLLLDLASAGPLGPHVLALLGGVYATGFWIRNVESANAVHAAASTAVATVLYSVTLMIVGIATRSPGIGLGVGAELTLAGAMYNAAVAPFAIATLRALDSLRRAPEVE